MRSIIYITIFVSMLGLFAANPSVVLGQTTSAALQNTTLSLSTDSPLPGQDVTVTLKSYSLDADSSTIIWYVDSIEAKRGVGATTLVVKAPTLGKKKTVSATVIAVNDKRQTASVEIGSGSIDIITETSGYSHPYFIGKLAPVFQNDIRITAIPHLADANGTEYNPTNLVYTWEKDGVVLGSNSGYGKQTLTIPGTTVPRPFTITVTAATRDGRRQARISNNVTFREPTLSFYTNDPLYGPLFNRELLSRVYLSSQRELGVLMVPYGFDKPIQDIGSLRLSWIINGSENSSLSQNESIIVRSPEGSFGTSDIGLRIQNTDRILQTAQNAFSISFKESQESSSIESISF